MTATTVQTIQIKRSHLVSVVAVVAALGAAIGAATIATTESSAEPRAVRTPAVVAAIGEMSEAQRAAAYGNVFDLAYEISWMSPERLAAAYGNVAFEG